MLGDDDLIVSIDDKDDMIAPSSDLVKRKKVEENIKTLALWTIRSCWIRWNRQSVQ